MPSSPDVAHLRARVGGIVRTKGKDWRARADAARADLAAQVLTDRIERLLAEAPPLTDAQRAKLGELLRPVRIRPGGAAT